MNREEELRLLKDDVFIPDELEHIVEENSHKYYRYQKKKVFLYQPIKVIALIFISMVTLFNIFPSIAYACKDIPVLEKIAEVTCFDETVKECLKNNYAIYIHQSDGEDNKLTLEYMIIDEMQTAFYFKSERDINIQEIELAENNNNLSISILYSNYIKIQCLYENIEDVHFLDTLVVKADEIYCFDLDIDLSVIKENKTIFINEDIQVGAQEITIEKLELSPSTTKLYYREGKYNTYQLENIKILIETSEKEHISINQVYKKNNVIMLESIYFTDVRAIIIQGISFVSDEYDKCYVDVGKRNVENLPEGMSIVDFQLEEDSLKISLGGHYQQVYFAPVLYYYENTHRIRLETTESTLQENKSYFIQSIQIPYYEENQYYLDIDYYLYFPLDKKIKLN